MRSTLRSATVRSTTTGSYRVNHQITDLGDLEREVLELVWANGPISADAVQQQLARPLKESTVRTVLNRLEEKGYLEHTTERRTFLYTATQTRSSAAGLIAASHRPPSEAKPFCGAK